MPLETPPSFFTQRVSTPYPSSTLFNSSPNASPTHPTMRTLPPSFPIAAAWFAPFPPGLVIKPSPPMVIPFSGINGALITKSIFKLPTTKIFIFYLC